MTEQVIHGIAICYQRVHNGWNWSQPHPQKPTELMHAVPHALQEMSDDHWLLWTNLFRVLLLIIKAAARMNAEILSIVSAHSTFFPLPSDLRNLGLGAIMLKNKNPSKFNEEKVAPSLEQNYAPTILDHARHWWSLPKWKIKFHKYSFSSFPCLLQLQLRFLRIYKSLNHLGRMNLIS